MATGISLAELRKADGKKLRIFLNQFVSDEDMVFLKSATDTQGEIKSPGALTFTDSAIERVGGELSTKPLKVQARYTPSTASRSYKTIHDAIMAKTASGEWILTSQDFALYCKNAGFWRGVERLSTPLSSLAKTPLYGGQFGVVGAGGVTTEKYSEVLSMYCLAYRIVEGKLLTPGSDFNVGADLNSNVWPRVAKKCWISSSTFSFKDPNDRKELVKFATKLDPKSSQKYTWLASCIAQSKIMMQKLAIKNNANIFNDKYFAKGSYTFDPYMAYLKSGNTANPNKWNPADIWIFNANGLREMRKFNGKVTIVQASVVTLNEFLVKQWNAGNIFPISLKKVNPSSPNFSLVNSNEYIERINITNQNNPLIIEFDGNNKNRDVKINFVLETVKLKPGMTAQQAQRNIFGNIGTVQPAYTKEIRLKFKANTRGLDLEYVQTGKGKKKYSDAKGGAIGYVEYNKIVSGTSEKGIKYLNTIKDHYDNTNLILNKDVANFTSHGLNIGRANLSLAAQYLEEIWNELNSNTANLGYLRNSADKMKDKIIAGELGVSIHKIGNDKVKRVVIQHLYNACASVGIGVGVDKTLLSQVGAGLGKARNIDFLGGIHGKVY